jgi:hypothetical protein
VETTSFAFKLIFATLEGAIGEAALLDALFEAGCGDGVVGLGRPGFIGLSFTREGADAEAVVLRAVTEALEALPPGASLSEVQPEIT